MRISIITPVLNGATYLDDCIQSVLSQTHQDVEHILIDGGSMDGSRGVISWYAIQYPSRVVAHLEKDNGAGDAWNWGITHATGEILGWLGADDLYLPDTLSTIANFFETYPAQHFVYGETEMMDEGGKYIGMYRTRPHTWRRLLNSTVYIVPTSAFYRKSVFDKCGLLPSFGSDYEAWLRIGRHFPFHYMKGVTLSRFRVTPQGSSSKAAAYTIAYNYKVSRQYGGHQFNDWWWLYYATQIRRISDPLKPLLGWSYPMLNKVAQKFIRIFCYREPMRRLK